MKSRRPINPYLRSWPAGPEKYSDSWKEWCAANLAVEFSVDKSRAHKLEYKTYRDCYGNIYHYEVVSLKHFY